MLLGEASIEFGQSRISNAAHGGVPWEAPVFSFTKKWRHGGFGLGRSNAVFFFFCVDSEFLSSFAT